MLSSQFLFFRASPGTATFLFCLIATVLMKNGLKVFAGRRFMPVFTVLGIAIVMSLVSSIMNSAFWTHNLLARSHRASLNALWLASTTLVFLVPLVTQTALTIRMYALLPPVLASTRQRNLILATPVALKFVRIVILSVAMDHTYRSITSRPIFPANALYLSTNWSFITAELWLAFVDSLYASTFLLGVFLRSGRRNDSSLLVPSHGWLSGWLRLALYGCMFSFVFPTLFSLALAIAITVRVPEVILGYMLIVNVILQNVGGVLGTLSAQHRWRNSRYSTSGMAHTPTTPSFGFKNNGGGGGGGAGGVAGPCEDGDDDGAGRYGLGMRDSIGAESGRRGSLVWPNSIWTSTSTVVHSPAPKNGSRKGSGAAAAGMLGRGKDETESSRYGSQQRRGSGWGFSDRGSNTGGGGGANSNYGVVPPAVIPDGAMDRWSLRRASKRRPSFLRGPSSLEIISGTMSGLRSVFSTNTSNEQSAGRSGRNDDEEDEEGGGYRDAPLRPDEVITDAAAERRKHSYGQPPRLQLAPTSSAPARSSGLRSSVAQAALEPIPGTPARPEPVARSGVPFLAPPFEPRQEGAGDEAVEPLYRRKRISFGLPGSSSPAMMMHGRAGTIRYDEYGSGGGEGMGLRNEEAPMFSLTSLTDHSRMSPGNAAPPRRADLSSAAAASGRRCACGRAMDEGFASSSTATSASVGRRTSVSPRGTTLTETHPGSSGGPSAVTRRLPLHHPLSPHSQHPEARRRSHTSASSSASSSSITPLVGMVDPRRRSSSGVRMMPPHLARRVSTSAIGDRVGEGHRSTAAPPGHQAANRLRPMLMEEDGQSRGMCASPLSQSVNSCGDMGRLNAVGGRDNGNGDKQEQEKELKEHLTPTVLDKERRPADEEYEEPESPGSERRRSSDATLCP
ncbi:hypothetical protein V8E36_000872 [Tilletia maclaganii]